jgi:hypothetical protein
MQEKRINDLLDLAFEMEDDLRESELRALFGGDLLPLIERTASVTGLCAMRIEGTFARAGSRDGVKGLLPHVLKGAKRIRRNDWRATACASFVAG